MGFRTIITDYEAHSTAIRQVRDEVFVAEQQVDRSEEFDNRDAVCRHVVIFEGPAVVATGRIDLEKDGKIGRVAVLRSHRRRGVGTLAMRALEEFAMSSQAARVWCHAQTHAIPFYESLGYCVCSAEFSEANIPHVKMEKVL